MIDSSQRDKSVKRIILLEGSANVLVLVAKLFVGFTTGSLAILGDAVHSLTDIINNIVAWVVIRLSSLPADKEHPYGHRKFETLAVFILASLLVLLSFELAMQAIKREDSEIFNSTWGLVVMLGVLVVNISISIWQRRWALRLNSDILLADSSHTFSDALTTIVVIIGWQLSAMGYVWLDRICALGVAALVLYLAFSLFKKSLPILLDESSLDAEVVTKAVTQIDGVLEVSRVRSRWIGSDKSVDLVISVNPDISTEDSHDIASAIEQLIENKFCISDISIHVEPYNKTSPAFKITS